MVNKTFFFNPKIIQADQLKVTVLDFVAGKVMVLHLEQLHIEHENSNEPNEAKVSRFEEMTILLLTH
jgi:hypothetical protein